MIKVVIAIPTLGVGGAENMVVQLAKYFDKLKYNVIILVLSSRKNTVIEKYCYRNHLNVKYFNKDLGFHIRTVKEVYRYLNKVKPDVVHSHLSACVYVSGWTVLHNKILIHTIHNQPNKENPYMIRLLLKLLYCTNRAVPVAISKNLKNETANCYHINPKKIEMIYNPVNTKLYLKKNFEESKDYCQFIHVGRFNKVKNQLLLVNAFLIAIRKLGDAKLVFVGDGEEKQNIVREVEKYDLCDKVEFTGNIENVNQRLMQSDVFILCSHYEGVPLSILEAMATGLPIITTNVGGIKEIVKNNGILITDNHLIGLANAMIQMGLSSELRNRCSFHSLEYIKEFDIKIITRKYETLYEKYNHYNW